uniref:medium-chain acyl-CoA ligase n=1 Tax=Sarcophilus harrisii TaxID=9305 RepID=A0A7N4PCC3_SARHA
MQLLMRSQVLRGLCVSWTVYGSLGPRPRHLLARTFSRKWGDYEIPKEFNFASDVMDHWARMEKEGKRDPLPALWWVNDKGDEIKWNFQELGDLTRQTANVLTENCGLQRGDRLIIILPRIPELWLLSVGCMRTGLVLLPGTIQLTAKDILYRLQSSKAKGIVTYETLAPVVDSVASDCPQLKTKVLVSENSRDGWLHFKTLLKAASIDHTCVKTKVQDPLIIFFTSGTTGLPKMTLHSSGLALRSCLPSSRQILKLMSSDISWCLSDPGWILSFVGTMIEPWNAGACSFIRDMSQFNPETILKTLSKFPITCTIAASSVYRMLLQFNISSYKFPTLKHSAAGGEMLLPEEFEKWKKATGLNIHEIYGQSETGLTCAVSRGMKIKKGSMGKAIPPFEMQIIDDKGNILPPGTEGNIAIRIKPTRPIGLFSGYLVVKAFVVLTPEFRSHDPDKLVRELQQHVKKVTAPYKYPRMDILLLRFNCQKKIHFAIMKILFQLQMFRFIWNPKFPRRYFHQGYQVLAPLNLSDFEAINRCERDLPENFNFAGDVLDRWAQLEQKGERPPNPALWWINDKGAEVKWNFRELGLLSRKVANALTKSCGLQRGERVAVILPRVPEWWLVNVACMRTGLIFMPGTIQLTAKDILYRLTASKAKCIVASDEAAPAVDSIVSNCPALKTKILVSENSRSGWLDFNELFKSASEEHNCVKTGSQEPMAIYFTSGTTGSPKMALHSQSSLGIGYTLCGRYWLDLKPSDIMWNMSDTGWVKAAIGSVFSTWLQGACVFVHRMTQFNTDIFLDTLNNYPITTLCSAPTVYRMLVQKDLKSCNFKTLRHCLTGGEPLNPEVREQWKSQTGLELYEGYGQTEVGIICANQKGNEIKPGSMGKGVPPYDVQIIDENCNILPPGKEGDIALRLKSTRPFSFFSEYVDNPSKTAATMRGNFYVTGDRGIMDSDGYFWFVGRADDVIISSGYRIGPFEVESALIEHPAVVESAVVSSPDPIRGEVVKAFVVLSALFKSANTEKLALELQNHVKKVTAPYKYPRKVEFVQELPKTITGKIKRNVLRDQEWGRA